MAQYTAYSVSVTNASASVVGHSSCKFLTNSSPGNGFKVKGDPVVYTIASVTDDTHLVLSAPYQGATAVDQQYQITRDYTPNFGLAEICAGDQDWHIHLTQEVIRKLDTLLGGGAGYINGDNMIFTDTVTGTRYFLRFINGQLNRVEV